MTMSTIDHDDSLKLGHGDAQAAKAPAKKFALAEIQDRTLWSPGIFAVLSMGLGAYLGRLRDMVNPAPNTQVPEDKKTVALNDDTAPPVEDDAESGVDIAAFWQEIQRRYEDVVEQIEQPRRLYSSIRYNAQDFMLEGGYTDRPFQGVSIDVAANGFRFVSPTVARPRLSDFTLPKANTRLADCRVLRAKAVAMPAAAPSLLLGAARPVATASRSIARRCRADLSISGQDWSISRCF